MFVFPESWPILWWQELELNQLKVARMSKDMRQWESRHKVIKVEL